MNVKIRILSAALLVTAVLGALPAFAAAPQGVVNINTASVEQLQLLPHVGPSVAARIVEYREQSGKFKTAEDLMLVRGIGEKSFERLSPYVAVSGETTLGQKVSSRGSRTAKSHDSAAAKSAPAKGGNAG